MGKAISSAFLEGALDALRLFAALALSPFYLFWAFVRGKPVVKYHLRTH